ncbi:hypothetical protein SSP531S_03980 [Streptomyces spongiicola]|uniref:Zinc-finger domain-containing protein n=1 Tax=Streptomyces spongiicola TaxID=1690221 RepID=A0A388SVH4_9ACTN|nr:hypothetical protein SSP531S_03980 [Streptomyces spongiicola]
MREHLDPADLAELALEGRAVDEAPPPVREHLRACAGCRNELDELRRLVGAVRTATSSDLVGPPPPGVWDRLARQAGLGRAGRKGRARKSRAGKSGAGKGRAGWKGRSGRGRKVRAGRRGWKVRAGRRGWKVRAGRRGWKVRVFVPDSDGAPASGGLARRRNRLTAAVLLAAGLAVAAARCAARWTRRRRSVREDPLRRRA